MKQTENRSSAPRNTRLVIILLFVLAFFWSIWFWTVMSPGEWTRENLDALAKANGVETALIPQISPEVQAAMNTPGGDPSLGKTTWPPAWNPNADDAPDPFGTIWLGDTKAQVKKQCEENGGIYDERVNNETLKQWPVCYAHDHYFQVHLPKGTVIGCTTNEVCDGTSTAPQ